jgi:hypothetical protein
LPPDRGADLAREVEVRVAVLTGAVAWLRSALRRQPGGIMAVIDRWTLTTEPMSCPSAVPALPLDQMRQVRVPRHPRPQPVPGGTGLAVVTWRIG